MRHCFAAGFESASERLADTAAASTGIALRGVSSSAIGDLDPDQACPTVSQELIAGVSQRLEGQVTGTALFAVDPGDALLWLQREGAADDPLTHFVDWGSRVLAGVASQLASAWQAELHLGDPVLEERPFMAALLSTHAPSDTVVLSVHGELSFEVTGVGEMHAPFCVQVLLEPKMLAGILAGLDPEAAEPSTQDD